MCVCVCVLTMLNLEPDNLMLMKTWSPLRSLLSRNVIITHFSHPSHSACRAPQGHVLVDSTFTDGNAALRPFTTVRLCCGCLFGCRSKVNQGSTRTPSARLSSVAFNSQPWPWPEIVPFRWTLDILVRAFSLHYLKPIWCLNPFSQRRTHLFVDSSQTNTYAPWFPHQTLNVPSISVLNKI